MTQAKLTAVLSAGSYSKIFKQVTMQCVLIYNTDIIYIYCIYIKRE